MEAFPTKKVVLVHSGPRLLSRGLIPPKAMSYAYSYLTAKGVEIILSEKVVQQQGLH